ncbi:MAG: hypothetical protein WHT09_06685 [Thermogutta sp.]
MSQDVVSWLVISPERLTTADRQIPVALATIEPCFDSTSKGYGEDESRKGTLVVPGVPSPRGVTIVVGAIHELPLPNANESKWIIQG